MLTVWANEGPFEYKGKYWHVTMPDPKDWEFIYLKCFMALNGA